MKYLYLSRLGRIVLGASAVFSLIVGVESTHAAGILKPKDAADQFEIRRHDVHVIINNGYAMTEVDQVFFNPSETDSEAIYQCPLPKESSLSEFSLFIDEKEIMGEVVEKQRAEQIYQEEKTAGRDAGLARKNDFYTYEFLVSPIRAGQETRVRYLYYQPIRIDAGTGRYLYPLEDGGTDDAALAFWSTTTKVTGTFSFNLELKSAYPVDSVRVPNQGGAAITQADAGYWTVALANSEGASLDQDIVVYYRLAGDLPGRLEVVPFRDPADGTGTFMAVLTPGMDLSPITEGTDWCFVLDVSGSMQSKLGTLAGGMERVFRSLSPDDRFRVVTFDDRAREVISIREATAENIEGAVGELSNLQSGGSTNLYAGLELAIDGIEADRTSGLVLMTDGVANTGSTEQKAFEQLLKQKDVRVFTAVLGNGANWPLMEFVSHVSQGFCVAVSNNDDLVGQLILATNKVTHQALHDVRVDFSGVQVDAVTPTRIGTLYHGQQLLIFGQYSTPGRGMLTLRTKISGEEKTYSTAFELPDSDLENPELERMWALSSCEDMMQQIRYGGDASELSASIVNIATQYSIVTDYTSMIVVSEEQFEKHGIDRSNDRRVSRERQARETRSLQLSRDYTAQPTQIASADPSSQPTGFGPRAPRIGGGGAIDPLTGLVVLTMAGCGIAASRRGRKSA